ncbi:MAG: protein kinase [Acidobacteria bacterium]|jgi:serine/threonine protein kinase/Tfp pilus assembly protein PilF|nr:protein kinase [Acidobacteriota bacterium]
MDTERLKQIEEIYHAALEIQPDERESFFREHCGADENLRREVESLLSFENTSDSLIDTPPESLAAEMLYGRTKNLKGKKLGHYKILSLLGKGGMGAVYLAEDIKLDRKIAVKLLSKEFGRDTDKLNRFIREAKAASALNHPNILTVYEIGEVGGINYIATEFIDGKVLSQHNSKEKITLESVLDISIQIVSALQTAHEAGIVHRDIKPDNLMIRKDGIVKVLDFGLAKLSEKQSANESESEAATIAKSITSPGMIMGTPNYMSPEQATGKGITHQTDIFSFGIVLYEMLSGRLPFQGESPMDVIGAILHKEPLPLNQILPELPDEIEQIVGKALRKNTGERYQNTKDLLADLRSVKQRLDYEEVGRSFPPQKSKTNLEAQETKIFDSSASGQIISMANAPPNNLSGEILPLIGRDITDEAVSGTKNYSTSDSLKTRTAIIPPIHTTIPDASPPPNFLSHIRRKSVFLTISVIFLAAAGGFFGYRYLTANASINSIAVLPFVNVGDDRDSEYLADGLSENLINTLSRLPQLKVIARSSSFKFRGENIDIQDAAKKLGVAAILTGRVVRRGDDLQISVELINTADNTRIWGDIYNRKVSAALSMPEEIAQAVSEKLQLKLSGAQERQMAKQITDNPQAYQSYMNGVFFRRKNGAENIRKAIEYQKQAIALDPSFVRAYTELSINFTILVEIGTFSPKEGMPPARAAAEMALSLDETLAEAHYTLARVRDFEFDWAGAEQGFKRAIELNPNLAGAHTLYAEYLSRSGRFDEALREVKRAQELDPLRTGLVGNEGLIFYHARRYDEAIAKKQIHAQLAAENPFAHLELANAYVQKGQYAEAILSYQTSIKLEETTSALIYLGRVYALSGKRNEAIAILDKLKTTEKYVSPTELAILYAALGDKEKAFASLEKAYTERDFQLTSLKVEPGYDPLRDDPRFQDLMRRVGFPQ